MPTINNPDYNDIRNIQFAEQYNNSPPQPSDNEYELVVSFFEKNIKDKKVAANFATSLFQVSSTTGVPIQELLASLKGQDGMTLSATMAYYINSIRSKSTLLGVKTVAKPNYYAARNVLS